MEAVYVFPFWNATVETILHAYIHMYINSSMQKYSNGSGTIQHGTKTAYKYLYE